MKFELHLRENLIPEWRDQYVDYQGGKKLLKKLFKSKSPSFGGKSFDIPADNDNEANSSRSSSGASIPIESSKKRAKSVSAGQAVNHQFATSPFGSRFEPDIPGAGMHRTMSFGQQNSLELPPPAIPNSPDKRKDSQDNRTQETRNNDELTDRSPLLDTPRLGYASTGTLAAQRRTTDIHMENISKRAKEKTFIVWMDSQVKKVEDFYTAKEKWALERFLTLQDQFVVMDSERRRVKNKMKEPNGINSTAKNIISKKIELPSLPDMVQEYINKKTGHEHKGDTASGSSSQQEVSGVAQDYTRKVEDIHYSVARRKLKVATTEFYISLELLKGYRSLNVTAVRKMMKKFDKTADTNYSKSYMNEIKTKQFVQGEVLDNLVSRTEDTFALYIENGNHKRAVEKLRAKEIPESHYTCMFLTGLFLGLAAPLFIQAVVVGVRHLKNPLYPDARYLFQIWGGFFLVALILCLFTLNCCIWTKCKINYPFIFEFDQRNHLDYQQYGVLPSFIMFLLSLFGWLSMEDFFRESFPGKYFPPIFLGIAVLIFVNPLPIFHWRSRKWLLTAVSRLVFSGLYPVEFRDFFLGDVFCSLNYSLSNISMFFCLYADHWKNSDIFRGDKVSRCSSSKSRVLGFLNCLPGIWRFIQCIRRFGDSGDWFPHLANAAKYLCWILTNMFLSYLRINRDSVKYKACYITFATLNSVYSIFWDIVMDFSLGQFYGSKNRWLRNELAFRRKWPYYSIMIIDPILRFNWIFYTIFWGQIEQSATVSFFVAFSELIRRFLWIFFRVENEHCANVVRSRASRDITLPYNLPRRQPTPNSEEEIGNHEQDISEHQPTPQTPASRHTFVQLATPVIAAVSSKLRVAHTLDFERRKPSKHDVEEEEEEEAESDQDDQSDKYDITDSQGSNN